MHVKKNVCEATCGTLLQQKFKRKDCKSATEDLNDMGIRSELYAEENRHGDRPSFPLSGTALRVP
jgi:hypothetical protein